jgi:multiple antibiotic resistance protein
MLPDAALTSFIAALFSMMNPIGNVGIFAGMTADRPESEAKRIAWTCAAASAITLLIVAWAGPLLLDFFGITVNSLRAAGGVIVLLIGLHMLSNKSRTSTRRVRWPTPRSASRSGSCRSPSL